MVKRIVVISSQSKKQRRNLTLFTESGHTGVFQ